jgi:hypothetical protein
VEVFLTDGRTFFIDFGAIEPRQHFLDKVLTCRLLAACCLLLAAGCCLLPAGRWLLAAGCWLLAAACWLLAAIFYLLSAICCIVLEWEQ